MVARKKTYEVRYGMRFPCGKVILEEEIAKEVFNIIKEKAPTFKDARKTLEIVGAMLENSAIG